MPLRVTQGSNPSYLKAQWLWLVHFIHQPFVKLHSFPWFNFIGSLNGYFFQCSRFRCVSDNGIHLRVKNGAPIIIVRLRREIQIFIFKRVIFRRGREREGREGVRENERARKREGGDDDLLIIRPAECVYGAHFRLWGIKKEKEEATSAYSTSQPTNQRTDTRR